MRLVNLVKLRQEHGVTINKSVLNNEDGELVYFGIIAIRDYV